MTQKFENIEKYIISKGNVRLNVLNNKSSKCKEFIDEINLSISELVKKSNIRFVLQCITYIASDPEIELTELDVVEAKSDTLLAKYVCALFENTKYITCPSVDIFNKPNTPTVKAIMEEVEKEEEDY